MSGHMWKQDNEGRSHPDDSTLLAYTRGQLPREEEREVSDHVARCQSCVIKCADFTYFGNGLQNAQAYTAPVYPSIISMLGEQLASPEAARKALRERRQKRLREDMELGRAVAVFAVKNVLGIRSQQASRPRSRAMASVPVAALFVLVVVVLTMVVAVLAFTLGSHNNSSSRQQPGGNSTAPQQVQPTIPAQIQPTSTPSPTPTQATVAANTPGVGSTVRNTPTATPAPAGNGSPMVYLCSSATDLKQSNLRICGKNFKPGDKIVLLEYIPGIGYKPKQPNLIADGQGTFSAVLTITNCRLMPTSVFAVDLRSYTQTASVTVNVTVGNCQPNVKPKLPGRN